MKPKEASIYTFTARLACAQEQGPSSSPIFWVNDRPGAICLSYCVTWGLLKRSSVSNSRFQSLYNLSTLSFSQQHSESPLHCPEGQREAAILNAYCFDNLVFGTIIFQVASKLAAPLHHCKWLHCYLHLETLSTFKLCIHSMWFWVLPVCGYLYVCEERERESISKENCLGLGYLGSIF